jgi:hypothetical protein
MGINIIIADANNVSTVIGVGARGMAPINAASQINGWTAPARIFNGPPDQVPAVEGQPPFGLGGGDCLFDTGSLFCFAGAQNSNSDNVLMVLWGFPDPPQGSIVSSGSGQLNAPPSTGALAGGAISWTIVGP